MGFLLCTPILALALLSVNSVPVKQTWSCPPGWSTYRSDTQLSCMFLSTERNTYLVAKSKCHGLGGNLVILEDADKRHFVKELARTSNVGHAWTGLYKESGSYEVLQWQGRNSVIAADLTNVNRRNIYWGADGEQCGYISTSSNNLEIDNCQNSFHSICEREVSCLPGYYGHTCERECHCLGELCDEKLDYGRESLVCKYGCQTNWAGAACDIKKEDPEVKYYCINSGEDNDKYVYIRIYTKGLQYRAIYGLTSDKVRGEWCNSTFTESDSSDLTTIKIPVNNISIDQMSSSKCAGQQVGPDTFSWSIVLKEYGGYLQELDAQFKITCDFSVADSLLRSGEFLLGREEILVEENVITPESLLDDVLLRMIDGPSGKSTTKAVVGTPVILEMKYALQQGSLLLGARPHSCVVYTQDGNYLQQLLDENGCQVSNSPVEPFRIEEDNKIRTPWFKLFTFENETSVTFGCAFDLCFKSDCKVGCQQKSRQRRDSAHLTDEVAHSTTRTIRVLPSIPAKGDGQAQDYQLARPPAAPPGYDMGPFVYLNPVTCSLFLLILLVFLCMYVAFIRTLRKSVYDIRKEIEVKRSRDKFLHCGCVQQKDRDYVAP